MASISLLVPLSYLALLIGALLTFSRIYRKRIAARIAGQEPWFPSHPERDVYISLLQMDPPPSDVLLKAALLRRAVTDVQRILAFREDKVALQALLAKGSIGDDLFNAFTAAEKELEAEILEVVGEANSFREGWGQFIFQSASECANNIKHRELFASIPKMTADATAKYGVTKTPNVRALATQLAVPSLQTPAPSSPLSKPATPASAPTTPSKPQNGTHLFANAKTPDVMSSPATSNGDLPSSVSATSSPMSQTGSLPKTGGRRQRKKK